MMTVELSRLAETAPHLLADVGAVRDTARSNQFLSIHRLPGKQGDLTRARTGQGDAPAFRQ